METLRLNQAQDFGPIGRGHRQGAQQAKEVDPIGDVPAGKLPNHGRVGHGHAGFEEADKATIPSTQVVDPDRRSDDHADRRRRGRPSIG
jgi:hypothetical protein